MLVAPMPSARWAEIRLGVALFDIGRACWPRIALRYAPVGMR
jgi:hypothetical protein